MFMLDVINRNYHQHWYVYYKIYLDLYRKT